MIAHITSQDILFHFFPSYNEPHLFLKWLNSHCPLEDYTLHSLLYIDEFITVFCFPFLFTHRKQLHRLQGTEYYSIGLGRSPTLFLLLLKRPKAFTNLLYAACNSSYCLPSFYFLFLQRYVWEMMLCTGFGSLFLLKKSSSFSLLTIKWKALSSLLVFNGLY